MHSPPASGLGFALQQGAQLGGPDRLVEERDVGLLDGGKGLQHGIMQMRGDLRPLGLPSTPGPLGDQVAVDAQQPRRQRERDDFRALARALGLPFSILHCHAAGHSLRERVQERQAADGTARL